MKVNKLIFNGYASRDAEVKTTKANKPAVEFNIAQTDKSKTGGPDETTWLRIKCFGFSVDDGMAVKKGDNVMVVGKLKVSKYQDKNGVERTDVSVFADAVGVFARSELPPHPKKTAVVNDDPFSDIPF